MRQAVQQRLLDLNRQLRAIVADEFDRTRRGLPAGMVMLPAVSGDAAGEGRVLDVGCGNGRFARALAEAGVAAHHRDRRRRARLLALAAEQTADPPDWRAALPRPTWRSPAGSMGGDAQFDAVVCLAVLHHFGYALRRRLLGRWPACWRLTGGWRSPRGSSQCRPLRRTGREAGECWAERGRRRAG